ncbi:MAG TPA: hypothetical protein VFW04_01630 [Gemmatimonadaceae bacterium]|nr:hypothetical protein [Gemmatimonadaceae bacterium]
MAKRRVAARGRAWVALALFGFVLIAAGVIWRRTAGITRSRDIRVLEQRRVQLESERAQLESDVRDLSSRSVLAPLVERRLGMRVPNDSQVVILSRSRSAP